MKEINLLFSQFLDGELNEEGIAEMNRLLIRAWFETPDLLESEILDYAEDLVIELFNADQLDNSSENIFRERIKTNPDLADKTDAFGAIQGFFAAPVEKRFHDPEEQHLRVTIQEIIRTTESPEPKSSLWLKTALSIAALFLIFIAGWYLFKPTQPDKKEIVVTKPPEPTKQDVPVTGDANKSLENNQIKQLVIHYFKPEKVFDYMALRGESASVPDEQFILAADCYNRKQYDSCLIILTRLTAGHAFSDKDTLNEIRYFSGTCLMINGWQSGDSLLLNKALRSFERISPDNPYYVSAQWYSALAYIRLGYTETGRKILEALLSKKYYRENDVHSLRNLIN